VYVLWLSGAAPAPFCSVSGSAGGVLLLLRIVTLSLLDSATLGAARLVTGAMRAAAPGAVRAAAAELDASVSDAAPALFSAGGGHLAYSAERAATAVAVLRSDDSTNAPRRRLLGGRRAAAAQDRGAVAAWRSAAGRATAAWDRGAVAAWRSAACARRCAGRCA